MLQQSWFRIRPTAFASVFKELALKNVAAKELLQKMSIVDVHRRFSSAYSSAGTPKKCYDQKEHVRLLVDLFDLTIQNLNAPYRIVQHKCLKIGEVHFTAFGAANESQLWEDLGEALTQSIVKAEAIRGKREVFRAWISIVSFLVDSMRAGYVKQFKRMSLSRNSSGHFVVSLATRDEIDRLSPQRGVEGRSLSPTAQLAALQLFQK